MGWRARVVYVVLPLIPAVTGTAIAIRFNNSGDDWMTALLGWAAGWIFSLMAIAGWEVVHGRPIFGQQDAEQPQWRRAEVIALAVVLVAAALLRVVALESYPIALHNDEMSCLLEARGFLGADKGLFTVGWFNCPNLGFFLTSLPIRALGPTLFTFRLSSVVFGLLSLIATYLIVRRFFGVRPAILLLIMTTPFHWHLHFSRTGFHYMQAASLSAVALLLFVTALDRRSPVFFGCAGVVTGIACQTYYAAWLTPVLLVAWSMARMLSNREQRGTVVKGTVVTSVLFFVTMAPLVAYYTERPSGATSRSISVYLLSDVNRHHLSVAYGTSDPLELLAMNAGRLGRFLVGGAGDTSAQYGLQGRFIDPFLLPFFLGGLAYALTLIHRPGGQLLWIWILGTFIAGGLLTIDAPFSPRLIGITSLILVFPALLIDRILRFGWIADKRARTTAVTVLVGLIMVLSTWWNLRTTFVRYPSSSRIGNRDFIVRLAADLGSVRYIANFCNPEIFDHQAYLALIPEVRGNNLVRPQDGVRDYDAIVRSLGSQSLVIIPYWDNRFYRLCDRAGGDQAGTIRTRHSLAGFDWCYVK